MVCTNDGKIIGVDLRSPSRIFKLSNKPQLGGVSAMCIDKSEHWICLGTRLVDHVILKSRDLFLAFSMRTLKFLVPYSFSLLMTIAYLINIAELQ